MATPKSKDWDLYSLIRYKEVETWCLWSTGCYEWIESQVKVAADGKYTLKVRICPEIRFGEGGYEEKTWNFNEMMKDRGFRDHIDRINAIRGIHNE